jgi:hypothetical protein
MTPVLTVLTGADVRPMKNGTPHPTGFWPEELVAVATPHGRARTVDPLKLDLRFNKDQAGADSQKPQLDKRGSPEDGGAARHSRIPG